MSEIIEKFAESYFPANNISQKRRVQVRRCLAEFEATLDGRGLLEATALDLERFLSLRLQSLAPTTVRKEQYQIRPFYTWARRHGLVEVEQYRQITDLPGPRGGNHHVPKPYTRDELRHLWALLDRRFPYTDRHWVDRWMAGKSPWKRVRRHAERLQYEALIASALYGGLRYGEVLRLTLDDLEPNHGSLPARARKNREGVWVERKVPIIEPMREAYDAWYEFRTALNEGVGDTPGPMVAEPECPWIRLHFVDFGWFLMQGRRQGAGDKHLSRIGTTGLKGEPTGSLKWGMHRLRHTCATEMLRSGYKIQIVRKIMGHASIEQTLKYAELIDTDVMAESDRVGGRFAAAIARSRNGHGA